MVNANVEVFEREMAESKKICITFEAKDAFDCYVEINNDGTALSCEDNSYSFFISEYVDIPVHIRKNWNAIYVIEDKEYGRLYNLIYDNAEILVSFEY